MVSSTFLRVILFSLAIGQVVSSCKQEKAIHKKPFKLHTATWYRISPTTPAPIEVNGAAYSAFAFFPGGGTGSASILGNCTIFFNQLAYGPAPDAPPAGSVAAPVKEVPNYPVTGAPLPLIQAGDFTTLSRTVSLFHIPSSIHDKIINTVIYNDNGDAVFLSAITGSGATFPLSETQVGFNGKALIVTGRGKFAHAIGEVNYNGYFNLFNPGDAGFDADGWVAY